MIGRWLMVVVIQVFLVAASFVVGHEIGSWQPPCPTEDSCRAEYDNGEWRIVQVIP